jgi:integrase
LWPTRWPIRTMPKFTDVELRALGIGDHTDGDGLKFVVEPSRKEGGQLLRKWVFRIQIGGKRRNFGLGPYPSVGAAQARQKAQDFRRKLAEGIDPSTTAKRRTAILEAARSLTLGNAIDGYLTKAAPTFKNAKSSAIRDRALHVHFASLHARDVASIMVADVAGILRTLKPETANKSHAAIRAVFDYSAVTLEAFGVRLTNPADPRRLRSLGWSPKSTKASTPHPALDWRQAPEFMAELARHDAIDARCLAFIILTVARAGAARQAKWRDIDLERRIWSVPIADLKDSKHRTAPFVVPLSPSAIDLIRALQKRGDFLFPMRPTTRSMTKRSFTQFGGCIVVATGKIRRPASRRLRTDLERRSGLGRRRNAWTGKSLSLSSAMCSIRRRKVLMRGMTTRCSLCGARCSKRGVVIARTRALRSSPFPAHGRDGQARRDLCGKSVSETVVRRS